MSYCRFSCDDFRCDLYCYADVSGGWTTHVATRRRVHTTPPPMNIMDYIQNCHDDGVEIDPEEFKRITGEYREWLDNCPWEDTPDIHGGQSFNDATIEDFKARLIDLRAKGYHFPDYVLEIVEEEIKEENAK